MIDHPLCRCVPLAPAPLMGETFGTVFCKPPHQSRRPDPLRGRLMGAYASLWELIEILRHPALVLIGFYPLAPGGQFQITPRLHREEA